MFEALKNIAGGTSRVTNETVAGESTRSGSETNQRANSISNRSTPDDIRHDNDRFRIEMEIQNQMMVAERSIKNSIQSLEFPVKETSIVKSAADAPISELPTENDDPLARIDRSNSIRSLRMPSLPNSVQSTNLSEIPQPVTSRRVDRITQGSDPTLQATSRHTVQRPLTKT